MKAEFKIKGGWKLDMEIGSRHGNTPDTTYAIAISPDDVPVGLFMKDGDPVNEGPDRYIFRLVDWWRDANNRTVKAFYEQFYP